MTYNKITIIGIGLIGSSIARCCKANQLCRELWALDNNPSSCEKALQHNVVHHATSNIEQAIYNADLVIIATPVGTIATMLHAISPYLSAHSIVSDTGSVKESVLRDMQTILPNHIAYIPAHPIAGTENSGVEAGFANLFQNRYCILTPSDHIEKHYPDAIKKITLFWESMGALVEIMDAHHHDIVFSVTSHIPHLVAYAIVGTAFDLEEKLQREGKDSVKTHDVIRFSAGGFRDFTRIAGSNPIMWRDVFLHNKEATLDMLGRLTEDLFHLSRAIRDNNGDVLEEWFRKTRTIRRSIIEEKMTHNDDASHK